MVLVLRHLIENRSTINDIITPEEDPRVGDCGIVVDHAVRCGIP